MTVEQVEHPRKKNTAQKDEHPAERPETQPNPREDVDEPANGESSRDSKEPFGDGADRARTNTNSPHDGT